MKRTLCLLMGLALPALGFAASTPIQASMVVTGTITVNTDGSVKDYSLHEQDKVPPGVVDLIKQTIQGWQFEPVMEDSKAVVAKAGMAVRVVAKMADVDAKRMTVRVAGAQFGCDAYQAKSLLLNACKPDMTVTYGPHQRWPPEYPVAARRAGAEGEVYLMVEIGRDGNVIRVATSEVNLYHRTRRNPAVIRNELARSAEAAAMHWKFKVPTAGPQSSKDRWVVQVPVSYTINGNVYQHGYGQWSAYIRGPVQEVPWAEEEAASDSTGSADAIAGGAPFMRDPRFVLKTPLGAGDDRS